MLKINSREEILNLGVIWWDESNSIRIMEYGVFLLKDNNYPKYFKYSPSDDAHFCGHYFEQSQEDYKNYLVEEIEKYSNKIKKLQEMLDNET